MVSLIPGREAARRLAGPLPQQPGSCLIEGFPLAGVAQPRRVSLQAGGVAASAPRPPAAARPGWSRRFAPRLLRGGELPPLLVAGAAAGFGFGQSLGYLIHLFKGLGMALCSSFRW